jgi:hypothetical protein
VENFESVVTDYYKLEKEVSYYSILPTATQYARNAISRILPTEMEKKFPEYWNDPEEGGKIYMKPSFFRQLKRLGLILLRKTILRLLTSHLARNW